MSIECAFFGSLGRDAELKTSKNGRAYLLLNIRIGDGDTAQWLSVLAFDPEAVELAGRFTKGAHVYAEGKLSASEWQGRDGTKRLGLSVMSFHCRLSQIGRRRERKAEGGGSPRQETPPPVRDDFHDDPIPF